MRRNKLKIIHISTALTWRGGEQQIAYLVDQLSRRQIPQMVFCVKNAPLHRWCQERKIKHYSFRKSAGFDPFLALKLSWESKRFEASVLHAHDSHAHTAAVLAHRLFGALAPIVITRRVDFPVGRSWFSRFKYQYPGIGSIVCVSQAIAEIVQKSLPQCPPLQVIHSAVDADKFKAAVPGKLRKEYHLPPEARLIGNVAALVGHKDLFSFIKTAAALARQHSNYYFFLIGEGELREELESFAAAQGLEQRLFFTGFRRDLIDLLPELELFLFTSEMEGLGTSVLDAFAAGVPVVATRAGGIPEMLRSGENGLLCPVKDHLALARAAERVLEDEELAQNLRAGGRASLAPFSPEKLGQAYLELYRGLQLN